MNTIDSTDPQIAVSGDPASSARGNAEGPPSSVRLEPDQPPGRCTRKALSFSDEIGRLYEAGYTLQAIRSALAKVGVNVSCSTVHREVTKARRQQVSRPSTDTGRSQLDQVAQAAGVASAPHPRKAAAPAPPAPPPASSPAGPPASPTFVGRPRGDEVAKAYMATQITNPFMRRKEQG